MILTRRNFLVGLIAAPAIVRIASLMPVKALAPWPDKWVRITGRIGDATIDELVPLEAIAVDNWAGQLDRDVVAVERFSYGGIMLTGGRASIKLANGTFELIGHNAPPLAVAPPRQPWRS